MREFCDFFATWEVRGKSIDVAKYPKFVNEVDVQADKNRRVHF